MSDKEELRSILLDLLQVGLLRIRVWGWNGRVEECAAEADRLHDVPDMIREMDVETIRRFYDFELRHFAENTATRGFYEADWKRLGAVLDKMQSRGTKNQTFIGTFRRLRVAYGVLILVALLILIGYGIFAK
ncbi:hypothetical protein [Granulicella sp. S156]|jgi:hypothetical protein|uniref:hypothetical protein n=1 Tax=Granulicella sp. S156 TaxID=1747224 RepID=UPI00131B3461|nr:hypothetical protein [Granulicella sp. S156]